MKFKARPLILLLATFFMLGNLAACFDEADDDGGVVVQPFSITLDMNSTNAAAVQGLDFVFNDLSSVDSRFSGETTVSFPTSSTMRIEGGGTVVEGPVTFGSNRCTVEGVTGSPCEITITTENPIQVNSYVSGSPLAQREDAGAGFLAASADLLRITPALLLAQEFDTSPGTIELGFGRERSEPNSVIGIGIDDECIRYQDRCTTGRLTDNGTVTGGGGQGQ